jgi:hypothetical protein
MKMFNKKPAFIVFLLVLVLFLNAQTIYPKESKFFLTETVFAEKFYRTELYFGMDKPNGGEVSENDWDKFLETEVTPLFPDGLTVLSGYGQFRDSKNNIERENSRVLILLYTKKERRTVHEKIEKIRAAYKKQFEQESVLRVDFPKPVEVSF